MFFSSDLLSKRDSGFGLLWLAATLGSKSTFKKLPKRSVMTADISQLCELIATPAEPLALRLSSNLLVGAARVYKVKQEMFLSDVTSCFNALKRVESQLRSMTASEGQLQMAQPSVKSSAVTLRVDPKVAFSMDFDAMVMNWDEYLNLGGNNDAGYADDDDDDYNPKEKKGKGKPTTSNVDSEVARASAHTLLENHEFLLGNSFDASFGGSGATGISSSQIGGFGFDDTFDGLDIGEGVGDDLVRELGEGWGGSPIKEASEQGSQGEEPPIYMNFDKEDMAYRMVGLEEPINVLLDVEPLGVLAEPCGCMESPGPTLKPGEPEAVAHSPSQSPQVELVPQQERGGEIQPEAKDATTKKAKRPRPLLDTRTELTDEELKAARAGYLENQNAIRCGLDLKKFERNQAELIHSLLWDAPGSVHAKELVDFWVDHFKAHVRARSGLLIVPQDETPVKKRRKITPPPPIPQREQPEDRSSPISNHWGNDGGVAPPIEADRMEVDFDYNASAAQWGDMDDYAPTTKKLRSSEEPGQARHASQPPPTLSDAFNSQRSALFPWDMAGNSSSISGHDGRLRLSGSDRMSVEPADARLRASSVSQKGSSLPSAPGSLQAGSPAVVLRGSQIDDDFAFEVPMDNSALESQQFEFEANPMALEKNSLNFLEYAKMQYKSRSGTQNLAFEDVVPKATSTAHVAAAAMYHCLVLATRDLLQLNQEGPYGQISIRIIK